MKNLQEGVVVLATRIGEDEHGVAQCVRNAVQRESPSLRLISARELRDALFPWLDVQANFEDLRGRLSDDALVRKAIADLNVRYAIFVSDEPHRGSEPPKGIPFVGWSGEQVTVSADVWDVKGGETMGSVQARASGTHFHFWPGYYFFYVVGIPDTEGAACRGLGEALARTLSPGER